MKCNDCKFWSTYKGTKDKGKCRRFAPSVVPDLTGGGAFTVYGASTSLTTKWPDTEYDDWCGDYQPKQDANQKPHENHP